MSNSRTFKHQLLHQSDKQQNFKWQTIASMLSSVDVPQLSDIPLSAGHVFILKFFANYF
jgi:hypothetical protein